jgi:hypothetical protein
MAFGSLRQHAPELRVPYWIDGDGKKMEPLALSDLGEGYKILYCFQHGCPGCHSRGFPTLKYLIDRLSDRDFGFAVVQTVFEGRETNTVDKLRVNQERYTLNIPFGHDVPGKGERYPTVMEDYRTAGTPWLTVIDLDDLVVHADFRLDARRFLPSADVSLCVLTRRFPSCAPLGSVECAGPTRASV